MAGQTGTLRCRRVLRAPSAEIYRAFTNATALREWLCDAAQADAHKGGRFYVAWNDGDYASGEYVSVQPQKVVISWLGKGEPAPTRVQAAWRVRNDSFLLTLTHSGFGTGRGWKGKLEAYERGWNDAFENLQSALETGLDLRLARRPLLGISGGIDLHPEEAERLGVPVKAGLRLDGITDGLAAQAAGMQAGDVITRIGDRPVRGWATLIDALQSHRAGDKVKLTFYRGRERRQVNLTLSARGLPEIPTSPGELADKFRVLKTGVESTLYEFLNGIDEDRASRRPSADTWSVKETLAHLIDGQRGFQFWMNCVVQSQEPDTITDNLNPRIESIVCAYPSVPELFEELERNLSETAAFVERVPEEFVAHKASYWRVGYSLLDGLTEHVADHLKQMRVALAA